MHRSASSGFLPPSKLVLRRSVSCPAISLTRIGKTAAVGACGAFCAHAVGYHPNPVPDFILAYSSPIIQLTVDNWNRPQIGKKKFAFFVLTALFGIFVRTCSYEIVLAFLAG